MANTGREEKIFGVVRALEPLLSARGIAINAAEAASTLGLSERTLQRRLQQAGTSFRRQVQQAVFSHARTLLTDTDVKIEAIARQLGYSSAAHFADSFRRQAGVTPGDFRARARR